MPYTHMWRRAPELTRAGFEKAVEDVKIILERSSELGVRISGPTGYGKPEVTGRTIAFNGVRDCGHRYFDYGEPWPTATAEGVQNDNAVADSPYWSGEYLHTRVCHGGSCAQGPFVVDRVFLAKHWTVLEKGGYFCKCETQFKPYDLVVTAALVRLKERLPDEIFLSSDGQEAGFEDAKRLCRELFGWPRHFELEPLESEVV
jgi:hypothetical protein